MFGVDFYGRVRLAVSGQGLSQREAVRRFGIHRGTVSKMVSHSAPPGYRRTMGPRRPKLDRHIGFIDQIMADDLSAPKKQRHTIQRIFMIAFETGGALTAAIRRCGTMSTSPLPEAEGSFRALGASCGARPGRLWRGLGGDRRRDQESCTISPSRCLTVMRSL